MKKYLTHAGSAVRYASRTTGVDFEKWLTWAAIGGVAYVVYSIYRKAADAGDKASKAIADAYLRVTAGPVIEVLGRAVLPNGVKVPLKDIVLKPDATFVYGMVGYRLTKRRPDNDYDAVKV